MEVDKEECIFCSNETQERAIYNSRMWFAVMDGFPVSEGHTLIISKRHAETYFDLTEFEKLSLHMAIDKVKKILDEKYSPNGYNIGINCGTTAGQTIPHCHVHIIPRYKGDVENPRGGVRGVIPHKQNY